MHANSAWPRKRCPALVPKTEALLRLETLPGEQAQIDWAHVGQLPVRGGQRALWVFVLVREGPRRRARVGRVLKRPGAKVPTCLASSRRAPQPRRAPLNA